MMGDTPAKRSRDFNSGLQRDADGNVTSAQDRAQDDAEAERNRQQATAQTARDTAQAATDRRQDQAQSATSGRVAAMDAFVVTPDETVAPPDAAAPSAAQRLRLHIPNVKTTLSMGAAGPGGGIREGDTGAPNFPGFGVDTLGHVFVDARGSAGDSKMRLQAKGDITLQTPESFAAGGMKAALIASDGGATLAGGGGAVIFGGAGLPWSDNQVADASTPDSPGWIASLNNSASHWSTYWNGVDGFVAAGSATATAGDFRLGKVNSFSTLVTAVAQYGGAVGGAISLYGFAGGLTGGKLPSLGGTVIHGSSGLIMGSGATAGLYSHLGTCVGSLLSVAVLAPKAAVIGLIGAEIKGAVTDVKGWNDVNITAGRQGEYSAHTGTLKMRGAFMKLGTFTQDLKQNPTSELTAVATNYVGIAGGREPLPRSIGTSVAIVGKEDIRIVSDKRVQIAAKETIEMLFLGTDDAPPSQENPTIRMTSKGNIAQFFMGDSCVHAEKGKGVSIYQGASEGGILVKKDQVWMGFSSNALELNKNGEHKLNGSTLKLTGDTIKLG